MQQLFRGMYSYLSIKSGCATIIMCAQASESWGSEVAPQGWEKAHCPRSLTSLQVYTLKCFQILLRTTSGLVHHFFASDSLTPSRATSDLSAIKKCLGLLSYPSPLPSQNKTNQLSFCRLMVCDSHILKIIVLFFSSLKSMALKPGSQLVLQVSSVLIIDIFQPCSALIG